MKTLTILYFAICAQDSGRSSEQLKSTAATPAELYQELSGLRSLRERPPSWRVAVNNSFAAWDRPLADGDIIAFIPPVSGG